MALATDPVNTNLMQTVIGVAGTSAEVTNHGLVADPAQGLNATRLSFNGGYAVLTRLEDSATLAGNTYDFELWLRTDTAGVIAVVYVTDNIVGSGDNTLGTLITNQWQNYRWTSRYPSASNVTEGVMVLNTNIPCTIEVYRYSAYKKRIAPIASVSGNVGETGYATISGSIFKFQADLLGLSIGGSAITLLDRSGNSTNAGAINNSSTARVNSGKPVLRFDGTGYYNIPFAFTSKPANWTIVAVSSFANPAISQFICGSIDNTGANAKGWGLLGNTGTAISYKYGDDTNYKYAVGNAATLTANVRSRLAIRYVDGDSSATVNQNGSALAFTNTGTAIHSTGTEQPFSIGSSGAYYAGAGFLAGDLYFLQIWPRALSDTELATIEASLISAGL